jgi:hypothetical protein
LRYEPGKNLLLADDAELFAAHVVSLLRDPVRRARLGSEGRKLAELHYGWDTAAGEIDALYKQHLEAPQGKPQENRAQSPYLPENSAALRRIGRK